MSFAIQTLRQKVGARVPVVDKVGRDVVRMRVAITATEADEANLKAYQYLPIGLAITGAMHATGTRDQYAVIFTELEVLDSQMGARLGAVVSKGTGTEVEKAKEGTDKGQKKVTLDHLKPLFDGWAQLAADFAGKYLRAQ